MPASGRCQGGFGRVAPVRDLVAGLRLPGLPGVGSDQPSPVDRGSPRFGQHEGGIWGEMRVHSLRLVGSFGVRPDGGVNWFA